MENNNTYSNQSQETSQVQPDQQQVYTQPVYQQPQQPVQQQPAYSYNPQAPIGASSPGKEIAGLILGITSLTAGVMVAIFGIIPGAGTVFAVISGLLAIGLGIAAIILHKKVHEQAAVITRKIEIGKNLATAGIITGGAGMLLSIIIVVSLAGCVACASLGSYGAMDSSIFDSLNY